MTYRTLGAFSPSNFRIFFIAAVLLLVSQSASAQTSAFNYNGRLADNGTPVNGSFQFEFKLYGVPTGGASLATLTDINATVANGVFNVNLDFGASVFDGNPRYLEIGVRPQGNANPYTTFTTRQLLTSVPYTIRSSKAATAEGLACNGCVTDANVDSISGSKVTGSVASATNAANLGGQPASAYVLSGSSISASSLTLTGNGQLVAPRIENLAADPEPPNASNRGRIYYNTASSELKMSNGSSWQPVSGTTTITQTSSSRSPLQIATLNWYETPRPVTFFNSTGNFIDGAGAMAFDGGSLYVVSNQGSTSIHKINVLTGGKTILSFSSDDPVRALAFDGGNLWAGHMRLPVTEGVYNQGTSFPNVDSAGAVLEGENIWTTWDSGHVTKMKVDGTLLCNISNFSAPRGIAFDGSNLWVAEGTNKIAKIRKDCEASPTVNYPLQIAGKDGDRFRNPYAVAFDGANLWITNEQTSQPNNASTVTKIRALDGEFLGEFTVGKRPRGLAFDGTNIWVANWGSNTVTKLRASDGSLVGTYPVGTNPEAVVFDGLRIWVSNTGSNNLTRF